MKIGNHVARGWPATAVSMVAAVAGLVCPACIPALGSLLASLGLGFAATDSFARPLLLALLAVNTGMLLWSAWLHRRWGPAVTGVTGAVSLYAGRYFWLGGPRTNQIALWLGAAALMGAALVNMRLKRTRCDCATNKSEPAGKLNR